MPVSVLALSIRISCLFCAPVLLSYCKGGGIAVSGAPPAASAGLSPSASDPYAGAPHAVTVEEWCI